jgi:hypothetical protein
MEQTERCKDRDKQAIQWQFDNVTGDTEMESFALALSTQDAVRKCGKESLKPATIDVFMVTRLKDRLLIPTTAPPRPVIFQTADLSLHSPH